MVESPPRNKMYTEEVKQLVALYKAKYYTITLHTSSMKWRKVVYVGGLECLKYFCLKTRPKTHEIRSKKQINKSYVSFKIFDRGIRDGMGVFYQKARHHRRI